jgi:hypothetical protein
VACPVCLTVGVVMPFTGAWTVFVQDRKYRRVWWAALIFVGSLWGAYFLWSDRSTLVRTPLDLLSTLLVVGLILRLLRLVFHHGKVPPGTRVMKWVLRKSAPYMRSPMTIVIKTFLLTLLLVEFLEQVSIPTSWYAGGVGAILLWWTVLWVWRHGLDRYVLRFCRTNSLCTWLRPKQGESNLVAERIVSGASSVGCPLGFGRSRQ